MSKPLHVLSLGAGVQSSTLALMAARGEIGPMPDAAIFSDTGWEPRAVYAWLDWLELQLPFPVHRVSAGNLRDDTIAKQNGTGGRFASIPWHMTNPDGTDSMGRRQCTREYKIDPITKEKRRLLGYEPRQRIPAGSCVTWIGISTDEGHRMKPSRDPWNVNCFPLIDARMSRGDCLAWMESRGYPRPPKSSCIGCPYHGDREWQIIKNDPEAWADAVAIDKIIREPANGIKGRQYMHRSRVPLDEVVLMTPESSGQTDLWAEECEGMCGL